MIPSSCNGIGSCMWSVLFRGDCCTRAAASPQYIGSTLKEFLALPVGTQRRFLRVQGECIGDEGQKIGCSVPIGDPRMMAGAKVIVPHRFAGRDDANFVHGEWDDTDKKHKPKARYEMPEGVGGP